MGACLAGGILLASAAAIYYFLNPKDTRKQGAPSGMAMCFAQRAQTAIAPRVRQVQGTSETYSKTFLLSRAYALSVAAFTATVSRMLARSRWQNVRFRHTAAIAVASQVFVQHMTVHDQDSLDL